MDTGQLLGQLCIGEANVLSHLMSACPAFLLSAELKQRHRSDTPQSGGGLILIH